MLNILLYTLMPVAAVIAGGVVAAYRPPGARLRSSVQHFAAGIVFAAVALELLPDIMHEGSAVAAVIGFTVGIALMLGIKELTAKSAAKSAAQSAARSAAQSATQSAATAQVERNDARTPTVAAAAAAQPTAQNLLPLSLLVTLAIDILIDGLLIGVGFAAGAKQGVLLTIALTMEVLFLGLSGAAALTQVGASRVAVIATSAGLGLVLAVGAAAGAAVSGSLTGVWLEGVLAFGAAALLYLVTEELLVEAHDEPETPLLTAMFFVGFVALLVIEMLALPKS